MQRETVLVKMTHPLISCKIYATREAYRYLLFSLINALFLNYFICTFQVKNTLWEGGVKVPAILWSPQIQQNPRVSLQMMHISDWLPTLYTAAGSF
jgi:Arylsulfatase A and related enzymes